MLNISEPSATKTLAYKTGSCVLQLIKIFSLYCDFKPKFSIKKYFGSDQ